LDIYEIFLFGGISKKFEKYIPLLAVIQTQFLNEAGIVGAALAARTGS
jgi:hypothetical protein